LAVGSEAHQAEDDEPERDDMRDGEAEAVAAQAGVKRAPSHIMDPPKGGLDEYEWIWKVRASWSSPCACFISITAGAGDITADILFVTWRYLRKSRSCTWVKLAG
jgi:hypothetical protein